MTTLKNIQCWFVTLYPACSLGYSDPIGDCFYDVWGDFGRELGASGAFPYLADLRKVIPSPGDAREVFTPPQLP